MPRYSWLVKSLALGFMVTAGCQCSSGKPSSNTATSTSQSTSSSSTAASSSTSPMTNPIGSGPFIVLDQFGYLPSQKKVAILRNPVEGFDADQSYVPNDVLQVVALASGEVVFTGSVLPWKNGTLDSSSGDQVWWFDFSNVTAPGTYLVRDAANNVTSPEFTIANGVYDDVLKQAVRVFFYQRAGFAKQPPHAAPAWSDGASHLGPGQDAQARLFSTPNDSGSAKDLSGGWYDAGDYNKYTNWTADYVIGLLHAYFEKPDIWGDDYNIPESGNGVPDILDEVKWGLDWLLRMQNDDGSVLSIVGLDEASPPSSASGPSYYGPANTSAALSTAAAFALGATVFSESINPNLNSYAELLANRGQMAWTWAQNNPNVLFRNNDASYGSEGLGAGQQEMDESERLNKKISAAIYLFQASGDTRYRSFVDNQYTQTELFTSGYASAFRGAFIRALLHYSSLAGATPATREQIQQKFLSAINLNNGWGSVNNQTDPYLAHLPTYTWGSSLFRAQQAGLFYEQVIHQIGSQPEATVIATTANYLHYFHGLNPLGKVYLSNMYAWGADNSVDEFYHAWFKDGSALWDRVGQSTYGPAPGFVVGGPNPSYNWDSCCPNSCGTNGNTTCGSAPPSPPFAQPMQKSFADFNTSWPINSWQITENSNGYQVGYIRLLSKFVQSTSGN